MFKRELEELPLIRETGPNRQDWRVKAGQNTGQEGDEEIFVKESKVCSPEQMGPETMGLKIPLQVPCQENPAVWKARNGHRVFGKVRAALSLVSFKITVGKGLLGMAQVELRQRWPTGVIPSPKPYKETEYS